MADCMQFLSENRLNEYQNVGRLVFQKPIPNRILVFRTSLENALAMKSWTLRQGANVTIIIIIVIQQTVTSFCASS